MIVRARGLGDAVCDPYWTETNQGECSDSSGNILNVNGGISALEVVHAANDPNYSVTVSASAPKSASLFGMDPKTLALIVGALLVFLLLKKR